MIACIRDLGLCGCPRCRTPTSLFGEMGYIRDLARRVKLLRVWSTPLHAMINTARGFIYQLGLGTVSTAVQTLLKPESWTPTVVCLTLFECLA